MTQFGFSAGPAHPLPMKKDLAGQQLYEEEDDGSSTAGGQKRLSRIIVMTAEDAVPMRLWDTGSTRATAQAT
jgi:hypothetical protein